MKILSPMQAHAGCIEVFANELRLSIVKTLREGPKTVLEITKALDVERTRVSHALKDLAKCHIISMQKNGRNIICSLGKNTPIENTGNLLELVEYHAKNNCTECHKL